MYRGVTVGVVIPAYNEEGYVGSVIEKLPEFIDRAYVVDDGSTDDTWDEITQYADIRNNSFDGTFEKQIVPIQHEKNRGVGGAIKTGYQQAREDKIEATAVLGGDDQMDPNQLTKYIDPIVDGTADYVKGNRFASPENWAEMPKFRMAGNVVLSYLTKVASGYWGTMDSQNGYTVISLHALETADIDGMYEYYGYCNDLLVRLNAANITIAEVPRQSEYAYQEGWKSHIQYKEYIPRVSLMLFRSFLWRLRRKYLITDYHPLGPLYIIGIGGLVTSVIGLVQSLFRSDSDSGVWLLTTLVSALTTLAAAELDRRDNADLERYPNEESLNRDVSEDETNKMNMKPTQSSKEIIGESQ